jgi:hypothetical protein
MASDHPIVSHPADELPHMLLAISNARSQAERELLLSELEARLADAPGHDVRALLAELRRRPQN